MRTPSKKAKRFRELAEKEALGTITPEELAELEILDKERSDRKWTR